MTKFPKKIYVYNEDSDENPIFALETDIDTAMYSVSEDEEIAIYELVKSGKVKETRRIAFE